MIRCSGLRAGELIGLLTVMGLSVQCTPRGRDVAAPKAEQQMQGKEVGGGRVQITGVSGEAVSELGESAYNTYCISCHGANGDGKGPASLNPELRPRNFTLAQWQSGTTDERIRQVIVKGGEALGMSHFMPPWSPLLEDKQIDALVAKVRSFVPAAAQQHPSSQAGFGRGGQGQTARARLAFEQYCVSCHGPRGQGDGPAAAALSEKPRDFSDATWLAQTSQERIKAVIQRGGVANSLSSDMPAWGNLFSDNELEALATYIRGLGEQLKGVPHPEP